MQGPGVRGKGGGGGNRKRKKGGGSGKAWDTFNIRRKSHVGFDEDDRKEFLTGFRKRKQQRRERAQRENTAKEKQERRMRRKEKREATRESESGQIHTKREEKQLRHLKKNARQYGLIIGEEDKELNLEGTGGGGEEKGPDANGGTAAGHELEGCTKGLGDNDDADFDVLSRSRHGGKSRPPSGFGSSETKETHPSLPRQSGDDDRGSKTIVFHGDEDEESDDEVTVRVTSELGSVLFPDANLNSLNGSGKLNPRPGGSGGGTGRGSSNRLQSGKKVAKTRKRRWNKRKLRGFKAKKT